MLNISQMSPDDRYKATTLFIRNAGRRVQAKLCAPEEAVGYSLEGEFEGYRDDHLIVKVKHGSAKNSTKRILWPFLMLEEIHFPDSVTSCNPSAV